MAVRLYCIEVPKVYQDKADAILHKYYTAGDIDVKQLEYRTHGVTSTVRYWLSCICSDDIDTIRNELKDNGLHLFN